MSGIELRPGVTGKMTPVRIAAGGESYLDGQGRRWGPDRYFQGGRVQKHIPVSHGRADPILFAAERWGHFKYVIPVASGTYTVRLGFAEQFYGKGNKGAGGAGSRRFDVHANGVPLLRNFDIFKEAGGENRAIQKVFRGIPANAQGKIALSFIPGNTHATVSTIEVAPE